MKCPHCEEDITHVNIFHQQAHCTNCNENITIEVKENIQRQSIWIQRIAITIGVAIAIIAAIYVLGK